MLLPKTVPRRCFPKLCPNAIALKLQFCKPVHQNGYPKPFCKAAPKSCAFKIATRCCCPKLLPKAATFQTSIPKWLPNAILQSGSRKLLPKVATESYFPKLFVMLPPKMLFFKAIVPESCSGQLAKAASQSCCPKLLPENYDSSNIYPKTSPQTYSAKRLPKAAPESCY